MTEDRVQRILVILPNNLGDVIMATPVIEGLRSRHPESHLSFLVEQGFEGGVENNPHLDELVIFPRKTIRDTLRSGDWNKGSRDFIHFIGELGNRKFDSIINLSQHGYLSNLVSLIPAKVIKGCRFLREGNDALFGTWSEYLYAIPFARRYNALHAVDVYRRIAGVKKHRSGYTIRLTDQEKKDAKEYLLSHNVDLGNGKLVVFQPGAAYSAKRWPIQLYATLGRMLIEDGWQVVLSGAPAEREIVAGIQELIGEEGVTTAGDTTFRQAAANCSMAQACVTGDTALMHAAAAFRVKTFALFGTTNPVETGPYGSGHFVFSGGCSQRPCFCDTCKSMLCMKSILPETVLHCLVNDAVPPDPRCDIYRTSVQTDGDYSLLTTKPHSFSYVNTAGAFIVRRAFETDMSQPGYSQEEFEMSREESGRFTAIVSRMENLLQEFLENREDNRIRDFETSKNELAQLSGIGAFWTALLNIRLNSIPMLDLTTGVRLSAEACRKTRNQIETVFASYR